MKADCSLNQQATSSQAKRLWLLRVTCFASRIVGYNSVNGRWEASAILKPALDLLCCAHFQTQKLLQANVMITGRQSSATVRQRLSALARGCCIGGLVVCMVASRSRVLRAWGTTCSMLKTRLSKKTSRSARFSAPFEVPRTSDQKASESTFQETSAGAHIAPSVLLAARERAQMAFLQRLRIHSLQSDAGKAAFSCRVGSCYKTCTGPREVQFFASTLRENLQQDRILIKAQHFGPYCTASSCSLKI